MSKNLWIIIGVFVAVAAIVAGIFLFQPSAEEILVQAIETTKTVADGHAVVAISVDSVERDDFGMVEVWARGGDEGHGAFRVEVLEASEEKALGVLIVSDGETLWAYSPSENKVFVGTADEAQTMMKDGEVFDHYPMM